MRTVPFGLLSLVYPLLLILTAWFSWCLLTDPINIQLNTSHIRQKEFRRATVKAFMSRNRLSYCCVISVTLTEQALYLHVGVIQKKSCIQLNCPQNNEEEKHQEEVK